MAEEDQSPGIGEREAGSVYEYITAMVDTMAAIAWQKLGLQPDIASGRISPNLPEAKVAIDITAHLAAFIHDRLDGEDKRRLESVIRDLRLNYVNKLKDEQG